MVLLAPNARSTDDTMPDPARAAEGALLTGFAETCPFALIVVNQSGAIVFVNAGALALLGYRREDLLHQSIDIVIPERLRGSHASGFSRVIAGGDTRLAGRTVEVPACRADGTEVPIDLSLSVWCHDGQTYIGAVMSDISERRERNRRLMHEANTDPLTGLANRKHLEAHLASALGAGRRLLVAALDIRGFRDINHSLGHGTGDTLLQAVAIRLPAAMPAGCLVARLHGDVFVVVLDLDDPNARAIDARTILDIFAQPFEIGGNVFMIDVTVGTALGPYDAADADELLAAAELARQSAKTEDRHHWRPFSKTLWAAEAGRRAQSDAVLKAFHAGELRLHYQPQVALATGRLVGVEALIRWQHPEKGLILPAAFLPAIQATALELPIGWWTLDEACRQIAAWRGTALAGIRIGVNLFPAQFLSGMLVNRVEAALARHGVDPRDLELEVTEVISLKEDDQSRRQFDQLRALGVRIALDDFGTGFASLASLSRFPLSALKIDRSFVRDLATTAHGAAITRAILSMAHELGLETVAEGIETEGQQALLSALGCEIGQGFLFSRALPADALQNFARTRAVA